MLQNTLNEVFFDLFLAIDCRIPSSVWCNLSLSSLFLFLVIKMSQKCKQWEAQNKKDLTLNEHVCANSFDICLSLKRIASLQKSTNILSKKLQVNHRQNDRNWKISKKIHSLSIMSMCSSHRNNVQCIRIR